MEDRDKRRSLRGLAVISVLCASCLSYALAQRSSTPLTRENVLQLLSGGVSCKRIASIAEERKIDFAMDSDVETQLRRVGATDALIDTLRVLAPKQADLRESAQVSTVAPVSRLAGASTPQFGSSDLEAKQAFEEALSALKVKKYEEAVTLFGRASREKPGWVEPLVERAKLETKLGRFTDAIEDCSDALRLSPNDAIALYFRGFSNYQLNRNDEAIADFNKALRLKPDYPEAYQNRGNAKWAIGDKQGANSDFATARSLQGGKR